MDRDATGGMYIPNSAAAQRNLLSELISDFFPEFAVQFAETRTINS
jgi:hypothetical protein